MPRGPKGEKRPADVIGAAIKVARIAVGETEEDAYSAAGRVRSGKSGSRARNEKLSAEERSQIAKKAASSRWRRNTDMSMSGKERLLSLLFDQGRELTNIKFFPGTARGLTADQMCEAATNAIKSALAKGPVDDPPLSGRKSSILE